MLSFLYLRCSLGVPCGVATVAVPFQACSLDQFHGERDLLVVVLNLLGCNL